MIYIVKTKTPVRYKNQRYKNGEELRIDKIDMNEEIFEFIEEISLEVGEVFIQDIEQAQKLAIRENNAIELGSKKVEELRELAKEKGIEAYTKMKKEELIAVLVGD